MSKALTAAAKVTGGKWGEAFKLQPRSPIVDLSSLKAGKMIPAGPSKYGSSVFRRMQVVEAPILSSAVATKLLKIRLVKKQSRNGKISTFSSLVAAGNGAGGAGFGFGRDGSSAESIIKAGRIAERSMEYFERFMGRTIFHPVTVKFKATILMCKPAPASTIKIYFTLLDSGRRAHHSIIEICKLMGIEDISCKVYGSTNPLTVCEAFFEALRRQKTPEEVAIDSGMKVVDVLKVYEFGMISAYNQTSGLTDGK